MGPSSTSFGTPQGVGFGKHVFLARELQNMKEMLSEKAASPVDATTAIDKANKVFGYNGWSLTVIKVDAHDGEGDAEKTWSYASAAVRIVLKDGTVREGFGFAEAKRSHRDNARTAAKQAAIRDGTRQALKGFGTCF